MKRGDIVLIRFPFSDLSSSKVRPALVISSDDYTQRGRDAIFVVISSNISKPQLYDLLIDEKDLGFKNTGLKKSSLIRVDKIVLLDKNLAARRLGELDQDIMNKVDIKLKQILDIKDTARESTCSETVQALSKTSAENKS